MAEPFTKYAALCLYSQAVRPSTTPSRRPARVALQAGAVPHHGEVVALGALGARIALHLGLGPEQARVLGRRRARDGAQFGRSKSCRGELGVDLEGRGGAERRHG